MPHRKRKYGTEAKKVGSGIHSTQNKRFLDLREKNMYANSAVDIILHCQ